MRNWLHVFFFVAVCHQKSSRRFSDDSFDGAVEKLSMMARLINGVSLRSEVSENATLADVIAELLGVESGDAVLKFVHKGLDVEPGAVRKSFDVVKKVPEGKVKDVGPLKSGMRIVDEMKSKAGILNATIEDPSTALQNHIGKVPNYNFVEGTNFLPALSALITIRDTEARKLGDKNIADFLKNSGVKYTMEFENIKVFSTMQKDFLALENASVSLEHVISFAALSRQYTEHLNEFKLLQNQLDSLEAAISTLAPILANSSEFGRVADNLEKFTRFTKDFSTRASSAEQLTSGLPNGVDDLEAIQQDLEGDPWLRKAINKGNSLDELVSALKPLEKFRQAMIPAVSQWSSIFELMKSRNSSERVAKRLKSISSVAVSVAASSSILEAAKTSLNNVKRCVKDLKESQHSPDFDAFDKLVTFAKELSSKVRDLSGAVESVNSGDKMNRTSVFLIKSVDAIENLDKNDDGTLSVPVYDSIRNSPDLPIAIQVLDEIINTILPQNKALKFAHTPVAWSEVGSVLNSLNDTGLHEALDCLATNTVEMEKVETMLALLRNVEDFQRESTLVTRTTTILDVLNNLKKSIGQVFDTMRATTRSTRASGRGVLHLENARKVSAALGQGVQVLHKFKKIMEQVHLIRMLSRTNDEYNREIEAMKSQNVWNAENRRLLGVMLEDLVKMKEKPMITENLAAIWNVFDVAAEIHGVEIDSAQFADPIAANLKSLRMVANEFRIMSTLDLRFSQHRVHLKAASITLDPVKNFFDEFFGLVGDRGSQSEKSFPLVTAIIIGSIVLIVTGLLTGAAVWTFKWWEKERRYTNREQIWSYPPSYGEVDLCAVVDRGRREYTKKKVKEGMIVNAYSKKTGLTPLHVAGDKRQPDIIKLLIKSGAYRHLRDLNDDTAEERLRRQLKDLIEQKKVSEAGIVKICLAVYEKLRDKSYPEIVPKFFKTELFTISLICDLKTRKSFDDRYPHLVTDLPDLDSYSHFVVNVGKGGVMDTNEQVMTRQQLASYIFHPAILVPAEWANACVTRRRNFYKDYEMRVQRVKYLDKTYSSVDNWKLWIRGRAVPALWGVLVMIHDEGEDSETRGIVERLGAKVVESDEEFASIAVSEPSEPHWFPYEKPIWVIRPEEAKAADVRKKYNKLIDDHLRSIKSPLLYTLDKPFMIMTLDSLIVLLLSIQDFRQLDAECCTSRDLIRVDKQRKKNGETEAQKDARLNGMMKYAEALDAKKPKKKPKKTYLFTNSTENK